MWALAFHVVYFDVNLAGAGTGERTATSPTTEAPGRNRQTISRSNRNSSSEGSRAPAREYPWLPHIALAAFDVSNEVLAVFLSSVKNLFVRLVVAREDHHAGAGESDWGHGAFEMGLQAVPLFRPKRDEGLFYLHGPRVVERRR